MSAIVIIPKRKAFRLKCKYCNYEWVYMGSSQYRASCPRCRSSIAFNKQRENKRKLPQIVQRVGRSDQSVIAVQNKIALE